MFYMLYLLYALAYGMLLDALWQCARVCQHILFAATASQQALREPKKSQ